MLRLLIALAVCVAAVQAAGQQPAAVAAPSSTGSLDQNLKELQQMVGDVGSSPANATANATAAPANATVAAAPVVQVAAAPANASAPVTQTPAPANSTNDTDYALAFARREDTNPATNVTVRLFMDQIPTVNVDNTSDATDRAIIHQVIHLVRQLIKIDLNGRFTGGHGIYFRHRMWKHLLTQTERALSYLKRVLEAQMALHNSSKERLHAALARVKECLHKIKLLKSEGDALRIDLANLYKRIAAFKDKDLSSRLHIELKESEKLMGQRQVEAKAARQAVTDATTKLQNAIQSLSTVMESIVGRMAFQSNILSQLNPMKDNAGLANVLEIIQQQISDKQAVAAKLESAADKHINTALQLRGQDEPFRAKQIVHFSDEVLQYQRRADMLNKLLSDAKAKLNEVNTTSVTVISS